MSGRERMIEAAGLESDVQLISVRIEGQLIGLPITAVRDVFAIQAMTPVPRADKAVAGLVNLRGHIVTILDLAHLLNGRRSAAREAGETMAVGVEWGNEVFGLVVDEIGDVLTLPADRSEAVPSNSGFGWARYARRVHKLDQELMIEIDLQVLLETMSLQAA